MGEGRNRMDENLDEPLGDLGALMRELSSPRKSSPAAEISGGPHFTLRVLEIREGLL